MSEVNVTIDGNDIQVIVGEPKYYGSFYSTQDQASAGANQVNKMTYNATDFASGVSIVSNSRITIANAGVYNIQFSAQFDKTDSGSDIVDIWLCKNGSNVSNTNTQVTLAGNSAKLVAAWNLFVQAAAGDYFELCWSSPDASIYLNYAAAETAPTRPAIPSVILTVNKVN